MKLSFASILLLIQAAFMASAEIVTSPVIDVPGTKGEMKYFLDDTYECDNIVIVGVGTAMSVNAYDDVASQMASGSGIISIIFDNNPGRIVKYDEEKYATVVNAIVAQVEDLIPSCAGRDPPAFVGGHSASGRGAINALPLLDFIPAGFVGMDPFDLYSPDVPIPSLNWGFAKTTCQVTVSEAAAAVYEGTAPNHRVLYQIQNLGLRNQRLTHCSFTDNGCPACPDREGSDLVRASVGASVKVFIEAIRSGVYNREAFAGAITSEDLNVSLFVNEDSLPSVSASSLHMPFAVAGV